jgi:hypothetical protein
MPPDRPARPGPCGLGAARGAAEGPGPGRADRPPTVPGPAEEKIRPGSAARPRRRKALALNRSTRALHESAAVGGGAITWHRGRRQMVDMLQNEGMTR